MPPAAPTCSVLIRSYNEEEHIGRLLTGILEQTIRPRQILLVDSGSTDATLAIAERFPVEIVRLAPEEFTFGRSLNEGCARARGEHLVIVSAHVYPVYPDWLARLVAPFHDPQVALVYGKQRGDGSSRYSESRILARWYPDASRARQTTPFCNNANAAIRRELWARHPYDEDLPGLEDIAWATWAVAGGWALAYAAEAEVVHLHRESPSKVYNRYRREAMALRRIQPGERFHLSDLARLFLSNVASDMNHARRDGVLRRSLWEITWFRWVQLWGTYRGFSLSGPLTSDLKRTFYYPLDHPPSRRSPARSESPIDYRLAGHPAEARPRRGKARR
jgi:glycosyltransferase involved in cell wall biosynthesis